MSTLTVLYQKMADLTLAKCKSCRVPLSCCAPEYCGLAEEFIQKAGVNIPKTSHPTLPYMSETGCVVPPHLRPLCTMHVCSINSLGFDPHDMKFTRKYFVLRSKINSTEDRW